MGEAKDINIELDSELWKEAKVQAIKESITVKEWVALAIKEKIDLSGK